VAYVGRVGSVRFPTKMLILQKNTRWILNHLKAQSCQFTCLINSRVDCKVMLCFAGLRGAIAHEKLTPDLASPTFGFGYE